MFHLYVLQSIKTNRHYIGSCGDLENRLKKHNAGSVRSTKPFRPWKIVYIETFSTNAEARKKEYELKHNTWKRSEIFAKIPK